jgi:YD repeat-containing protein
MGISSAGVITWVPVVLGTVPVSLEVRNAAGAKAIQSFQVVVEADLEAPVISLRPSGTVFTPGETLTLNLSATDNVAVTDLRLTLNGNPLSLIPNLPNQPNQASVVLNQLGSYTIQATAADFTGNVGTSSLQVRVPDPADKTPPVISLNLTSFDPTKPLTQLTNLVGSISGDPDSWRVELAPINLVDPANPAAPDPDYVTIGSGTGNTLNATLATIDPSLFRNDNYLLRVISQDFSGNMDVKSTVVGLFSEEKPADFKLDFTDLSIPLTGLPIQIGRSYSSLNAQVSGDFGYGWNLSFQDAQIQESAPDGRNLNDDDPFFGNSLTVGSRVTLTNPEGRRVGFTFDPQFVGSVFLLGNLYRPYFRPDAGVYDTLDVSLETGGLESLVSLRGDGSAASPGFIPFTYNPSTYFLRTKAGDTYQYNQIAGLIDIIDRNGNKLSYSNSGIVSSTGKSINFTRDGEGKITEIRDPEGKVIKYSYNAAGELVGVTDRTGNTTTIDDTQQSQRMSFSYVTVFEVGWISQQEDVN